MTVFTQTSYRVTVENYDGRCKRVTIKAFSPVAAMASAQRNGWFPVEVVAV